jgi:hypothetical protein
VQTLAPAPPNASPLLAGSASPSSSAKLEPNRARASLSEPPPALAKLAEDRSTAKAPANGSSVLSLKCNPPYAFDRNGRKKFRPECF